MKNRFRAVTVFGMSSCSLGWGLLAAPAHADIAGFGDFSGFTITQADSAAAPAVFPGQDMIQLTNQGGGEHRSIFFNTRQTITSFSAQFIYRAVGSPSNTIGACLVFQNSPAGASAVGANFNFQGFGYDGITSSVAISLEIGGRASTYSGLYSGGSIGGGAAPTNPVSLLSGNPILISAVYNGSILHTTFTDTVTLASYETFSAVNIPALVGGPLAYVGFTANTGNPSFTSTRADQYISNPHFGAIPTPGAFGVLAMVGGLAARRRSRPTDV